ncbi:hypothetical protein PanWU01x14_004960 [Parasponia andersonii]|uniref:Uncharacterized protein n=1 Tax=Parasponia andersonii TaxID=3476 RepID=A0A2P5E3C5_PARAD|nr:hypothetical protein PanWU01x14_004960 [Parasponia andersonii]
MFGKTFGFTSVTRPDITVNDREENPVVSNPALQFEIFPSTRPCNDFCKNLTFPFKSLTAQDFSPTLLTVTGENTGLKTPETIQENPNSATKNKLNTPNSLKKSLPQPHFLSLFLIFFSFKLVLADDLRPGDIGIGVVAFDVGVDIIEELKEMGVTSTLGFGLEAVESLVRELFWHEIECGIDTCQAHFAVAIRIFSATRVVAAVSGFFDAGGCGGGSGGRFR